MSIIIDIVIIAIILLCIYGGYKKGLIGMAFSIVSFIAALIIAFILFTPVSTFVINNMEFDDNIKTSIVNKFTEEQKVEASTEGDNEENSISYITNYINNQLTETKDKTVEIVATEISELCVKGIVFIALFIVARIGLAFFKMIANFISKLPLINQVNKLGGIIFGLLKGLIITYGVLAILLLVSPLFNGSQFEKSINNSFIGNMMYSNNIIVKILF